MTSMPSIFMLPARVLVSVQVPFDPVTMRRTYAGCLEGRSASRTVCCAPHACSHRRCLAGAAVGSGMPDACQCNCLSMSADPTALRLGHNSLHDCLRCSQAARTCYIGQACEGCSYNGALPCGAVPEHISDADVTPKAGRWSTQNLYALVHECQHKAAGLRCGARELRTERLAVSMTLSSCSRRAVCVPSTLQRSGLWGGEAYQTRALRSGTGPS